MRWSVGAVLASVVGFGCGASVGPPVGNSANGRLGQLVFSAPEGDLAVGGVARLVVRDGELFTFEGPFGSEQTDSLRIVEVMDVQCRGCTLAFPSRVDRDAEIFIQPERAGPVSVDVRVRREDGEERRDAFEWVARDAARIELDCSRDDFHSSPVTCGGRPVFPGQASSLQPRLLDANDQPLFGAPVVSVDGVALRARGAGPDDPPVTLVLLEALFPGSGRMRLVAGAARFEQPVRVAAESEVVAVELMLARLEAGRVVLSPFRRCEVASFSHAYMSRCGFAEGMQPVLRLTLADGVETLGGAERLSSDTPDVLQVDRDSSAFAGLTDSRFVLFAQRAGQAVLRATINGRTHRFVLDVDAS